MLAYLEGVEKMAEKVSLEGLKQIVRDLSETQRELAEQVSEAQQRLTEQMEKSQKKTREILDEVAEAQKKTEEVQQRTEEAQQRTEEAQQRTEESLKKTQAVVEKQSENLDTARGDFTRKWGSFMEKLVKGNLIDLLQRQGVAVDAVTQKFEIWDKNNKDKLAEFDLLAINGDEMVVVEVKTTLSDEKLAKFIRKLEKYKHRLPVEKRKKIYGAVAYLDYVQESKEKAIEEGLFVIEAPRRDGEFATIANPGGFHPRKF